MNRRGRRSRISLPVLLFATLLFASCGRQADVSDEGPFTVHDSLGIMIVENRSPRSAPWRLSQEFVIEFGDDLPVEQSPLDPTAVFTGVDGRIVVGDGNQVGWDAVLVYDANGDFLMKMGGPGRGPGEFGGQLWWAGPYRGDSIVAWDRRGPSIKVFGPDGGFARDVRIPNPEREPPEGTSGFSLGFHGAFSDGSFLTSSRGILEIPAEPGPAWYHHLLLAVDPLGATWDTIGEYRFSQFHWDGSTQNNYIFGAQAYELPYGDDLIRGNASTYEYQVQSRDGAPRLIVRKAFQPQAVENADVEAVRALFLRNVPERRMPETRRLVESLPSAPTKPAYSSILVDQERNVWIERFRWFGPWSLSSDPQPTTWDVFDPSGEWISEVVVPVGVVLLSISERRAFGVRIDELDVRHIVVFELSRS